jgi:hypothetical protein
MGRRVSRTSEQMILSLDLRVWAVSNMKGFRNDLRAFWRPSRVVTTYTSGFGLYAPPIEV